jgi:hypothetical protein
MNGPSSLLKTLKTQAFPRADNFLCIGVCYSAEVPEELDRLEDLKRAGMRSQVPAETL